jgi:hypothetical protein
VMLTFAPRNADGDAFPDSLDACALQSGTASNGCVDTDGDRLADTLDVCPTVKGDVPNGCLSTDQDRDGSLTTGSPADCRDDDPEVYPGRPEVVNNGKDDDCNGSQAIDGDGDGSLLGSDCNDGDGSVRPGTFDVPGNGKDEDCVGGSQPYPTQDNVLVNRKGALYYGSKHRTTLPLQIVGAVQGMRIEVRCRAKSGGCPFGVLRRTVKKRGQFKINALAKTKLPVGAVVEVRVARTGYITKVVQLTMRRGAPKAIKRCMLPGTSVVRKTC